MELDPAPSRVGRIACDRQPFEVACRKVGHAPCEGRSQSLACQMRKDQIDDTVLEVGSA